ncbi:MAG: hypothetical protein RR313_05915 [Anaerovoracaceae bacterium]
MVAIIKKLEQQGVKTSTGKDKWSKKALGGDYVEWIKFFMKSVIETSKKVISQLEQFLKCSQYEYIII